MPYYVYGIHTDSNANNLCGSFVDYHDAEICERDKQSDNYSEIMMIYAETQGLALRRIKKMRRERNLP
jgi:hypothetical protein